MFATCYINEEVKPIHQKTTNYVTISIDLHWILGGSSHLVRIHGVFLSLEGLHFVGLFHI